MQDFVFFYHFKLIRLGAFCLFLTWIFEVLFIFAELVEQLSFCYSLKKKWTFSNKIAIT